jgi:hypothetical protein
MNGPAGAGDKKTRVLPALPTILAKPAGVGGCVSAVDSRSQTIFVADPHRDDGKRFNCPRGCYKRHTTAGFTPLRPLR